MQKYIQDWRILKEGTITTSGDTKNNKIEVYNATVTITIKVTNVSGTNPNLKVYLITQIPFINEWQDIILLHSEPITSKETLYATVEVPFSNFAVKWEVNGNNPSFDIIIIAQIFKK